MHQIKENSYIIKEVVLKGDFPKLYSTIRNSWNAKKGTSEMITNANLENIYNLAIESGAHCGKISDAGGGGRSEEHTSELQSLMRISYAVFCLKKKKTQK